MSTDPRQSSLYQYYIKVVPTIYQHLDSSVINTNQFSVTEYYKELGTDGNHGLPGTWAPRHSSRPAYLLGCLLVVGAL